jgi:2-polyprenyl-3-methyl-5-hydroxy-6-metoxy-1,4-benzoquinol methylase
MPMLVKHTTINSVEQQIIKIFDGFDKFLGKFVISMELQKKDFEEVNCAICKTDSTLSYSSKGQFGLQTNVVICKNCGFTYLNPRWTKERYNYFYTVEYDNYYRPEVKSSSYKYDIYSPIKNILKRVQNSNLNLNAPSEILDIGCGMGDALIYLKQNIYPKANYSAIEPSAFCCEHLQKNNINIISNDVDSDWSSDNKDKFDIVIMRHVLEHFLDPISVLKKVSEILKPNGILYVAVPNSKKPTHPLVSHYMRVVHVSYFSELSLSNAFALSNLSSLILKGGDELDQFEIFSIAQKNNLEAKPIINSNEAALQKTIFDSIKRTDIYYNLKLRVWKLLQVFKKK